MNCIVCGREGITNEMNECPDCGFPFIKRAGTGDDLKYMDLIENMAKDHTQRIRKASRIGLMTYSYRRNGSSLELDTEKERILVEQLDTVLPGQVFWCDEQFARIESDEPITLKVAVHGMGKDFMHEVNIEVPGFQDLWKVGVRAESGLNFRILIGREGNYTETGLISLIR